MFNSELNNYLHRLYQLIRCCKYVSLIFIEFKRILIRNKVWRKARSKLDFCFFCRSCSFCCEIKHFCSTNEHLMIRQFVVNRKSIKTKYFRPSESFALRINRKISRCFFSPTIRKNLENESDWKDLWPRVATNVKIAFSEKPFKRHAVIFTVFFCTTYWFPTAKEKFRILFTSGNIILFWQRIANISLIDVNLQRQ